GLRVRGEAEGSRAPAKDGEKERGERLRLLGPPSPAPTATRCDLHDGYQFTRNTRWWQCVSRRTARHPWTASVPEVCATRAFLLAPRGDWEGGSQETSWVAL